MRPDHSSTVACGTTDGEQRKTYLGKADDPEGTLSEKWRTIRGRD
jgi:hypothetical protein